MLSGIYRDRYNHIVVRDDEGTEFELPVRLYELQGWRPHWETLPTEDQWRNQRGRPNTSPNLPR